MAENLLLYGFELILILVIWWHLYWILVTVFQFFYYCLAKIMSANLLKVSNNLNFLLKMQCLLCIL